jgi:hypothetical protein
MKSILIVLTILLVGCEKDDAFECPLIITKIELLDNNQARYITGSCVGGGNFKADVDLYNVGDTLAPIDQA